MTAEASVPDFAYPKQVVAGAEKALAKSLGDNDTQGIMRSLMNITIARSAISPDSIASSLNQIRQIRRVSDSQVLHSLIDLLLADIYQQAYSANRWNYDQRQLPQDKLSPDFREWSGAQFREKITQLCDSALLNSKTLKSIPIGDFSQVITSDSKTRIYYPTVYDFVVWKAIGLLTAIDRTADILPLSRLSDASQFLATPCYVPSSAQGSMILSLFQDLLRFHERDKAPYIHADLGRISYIASHIYNDGNYLARQSQQQALLRSLYDRFSDTEYSGDILQDIAANRSDEPAEATWLYEKLNHNISRFPAYTGINCLRTIKAELEQKQVRIEAPQITSPESEINLRLSVNNTSTLKVNIYRLPDVLSADTYYRTTSTPPQLFKSIDVEIPGKIPFRTDTVINVRIPECGTYIAVPAIDTNILKSGHSYPKIYCSRLALGAFTFTSPTAVVVDPLTGAPVSDASIIAIPTRRNDSQRTVATTASDGMAKLSAGSNNVMNLVPVKGNDKSALPFYLYMGSEQLNDAWQPFASAYTDLPIYRPGDRVEWTAIRYSSRGEEHRLEPRVPLTAILYDTGFQPIDTLHCTTDDFGRVNGYFDLPANLLTGTFNIGIADATNPSSPLTYVALMVSDYKLPTYYVRINSVLQDTPAKGSITLTGEVSTYSGFGMSGTNLDINLNGLSRSWWRSPRPVSFYTTTAVTGADGKFEIELPAEVLSQSPVPGNQFRIDITATSSTGESRETTRNFGLSASYSVVASLPANMDVSHRVRLNVKVTDSEGNNVTTKVEYQVSSENGYSAKGTFITSDPVVDWSKLPGGCYEIVFSAPDLPDTESARCTDIALYRPSDKMPPRDVPVWVPLTNYTAQNGKAKVLIGTSSPESNVLMTLWTPDSLISQKWIKLTPGIRYYEMNLPKNIDKATLSIASTSAFRSSAYDVLISSGKPEGIRIEAETFRDKITPGSQETWRFRVMALDNSGVTAAVILDMYNEALDALTKSNWDFTPLSSSQRRFTWREPNVEARVTSYASVNFQRLKCTSLIDPVFNTYGMPLFSSMRVRGGMLANTMMRKSAAVMAAKEEMITEDAAEMAVSEPQFAAAGMADMGAVTEATAAENTQEPDNAGFTYRQSETPLAFFRPDLTTDTDGHLTFSFKVPDANTTWRFNAIALSADVKVATYSAPVNASKPVMVQPNLPRFVRTGDTLALHAAVMNNTDSEHSISTVIEVFDPATDSIIQADTAVTSVEAMNSTIVSIALRVPYTSALLGFRIRSSIDGFTDGEQALIPVLPSVQPVIETYPFYLSPDSADFSMMLPSVPASAHVTLQYCDNPTWYIVTALPGLRSNELRSAPDAAAAIFSAAVAEGLLHKNPVIADALREWSQSDRSDSTLVSMLDRNADLKTVLLESSPWMLDARSDTERMQRLSLLFDTKLINSTYAQAITLLKKLQQNDGGWAWTGDYPASSEWATVWVLKLMGRLAQLGFMPSDNTLKSMLPEAVKYIDRKAETRYGRSPQSDFTSYVVLRDMYPEVQLSLTCRNITDVTVQRVLATWKRMSVGSKAESALLLYNHKYTTVSRSILASLREYAIYEPQKGMWWEAVNRSWPSGLSSVATILRAFTVIDPGCDDIQSICQWLILQKEAQNWGTAPIASDVVGSILLAVPQWTVQRASTDIIVAGQRLNITPIENRLGYLRTDIDIPNADTDNRLIIHRGGSTPAWGAIYTRFTDNMDRVQARNCDGLSIEKRILKQVNTPEGITWLSADRLSVGDRVRIELTIHATRNMDYVAITDERAACFEPVEQLPAPIVSDGLYFYRENLDASTRLFIDQLPVGTYILGYDMWVNNEGEFASGIATVQSQYAPELSAHSAGTRLITESQIINQPSDSNK